MRFDPRNLAPCFALCLLACGPGNAPPRQVSGSEPSPTLLPSNEVSPIERANASKAAAGLHQAPTGPAPSTAEVTQMLEASSAALQAGDRVTAERSLQQCLRRTPPILRCELQFIRFLETVSRRRAEARTALAALTVVEDPDTDEETYDELASRLYQIGAFEQAERASLIASRRRPSVERLLFRAKVLQRIPERLEDAIDSLTEAVALAPERADLKHELATLASRHPAHVDDAIALFETLREDSTDAAFRRTIQERIEELRRAAAAAVPERDALGSSRRSAPRASAGMPTIPASEGGSTTH